MQFQLLRFFALAVGSWQPYISMHACSFPCFTQSLTPKLAVLLFFMCHSYKLAREEIDDTYERIETESSESNDDGNNENDVIKPTHWEELLAKFFARKGLIHCYESKLVNSSHLES